MPEFNALYTAVMFFAMVMLVFMLRRSQSKLSISPIDKLIIGLAAFIGAMLMCKVPFVLTSDWENLFALQTWFGNGKTITFGIIGGYLGVELAKFFLGIKAKTGDTFALPVAVTVAIGRVGCFVGGCCFGIETDLPWGVKFAFAEDAGTLLRHPTQLYETTFHLAMAALILVAFEWLRLNESDENGRALSSRLLRGNLIKIYLIAYLSYRIVTEWIRPEPDFAMGLTIYQWISMALIPVFVMLWVWDCQSGEWNTGTGIEE